MTSTVLAAAREVFLTNGYKHTNVAQIAKSAGIATGSFYKFYASKQAIFLAVYDAENERLRSDLSKQLRSGVGLVDGATMIVRTVFETVKQNQVLMEWYRPEIGLLLHETYQKRMADGTYGFSQVLTEWLDAQIRAHGLTDTQQQYLKRGVVFLNELDQVLTAESFVSQTETLVLMVQAYLEKWVMGEVA